jgi:hypothetical protein
MKEFLNRILLVAGIILLCTFIGGAIGAAAAELIKSSIE